MKKRADWINLSLDTILYFVAIIGSIILLFIDGYYVFHLYHDYIWVTESDYLSSFRDLIHRMDTHVFIMLSIIILLLALFLFSFVKLKYVKSGISILTFLIVSINSIVAANSYGSAGYHNTNTVFGDSYSSSTFNGFSWAFYLELFLLAFLITMSILNDCGRTIIYSPKMKKDMEKTVLQDNTVQE